VRLPRLKRVFHISLRTMMIIFTVLCVLLGWKVYRVQRQKQAIAVVEASAGFIVYDYQRNRNIDGYLPGPDWLCELLGVDYFAAVVAVGFQKYKDIAPLGSLTDLGTLYLADAEQQDLATVARLANLRALALDGGSFSDLSPLAKLTRLEELQLIGSNFDDEEIERLKRMLPNCRVLCRELEHTMPGFIPLDQIDEAEARELLRKITDQASSM
jgi:hypothetical protein